MKQQENNEGINQKSKKVQQIFLKYFAKKGEKLSNCLMIVLQLYLGLNMKQNMENDSKY